MKTTKEGIPLKNFTKTRALLLLKERADVVERDRLPTVEAWLTASEIALFSNTFPDSIRVLLKRWASWNYVESHDFDELVMSNRRSHRLYTLGDKGKAYLGRLHKWYHYIDSAKAEVKQWQELGREYPAPRPKSITFAVEGSTRGVILYWPFASIQDVRIASQVIKSRDTFLAESPDRAIRIIAGLYDCAVSDDYKGHIQTAIAQASRT